MTTDTPLAPLWEATSRKLRDEHKVVNRLEELLRNNGIYEGFVVKK